MWMNVACLVGRAASEPKQKKTAGGTEYVTLRVAVPRNTTETDFFTVELWGRLAKVALKNVRKGRTLSLRCELRQETWGDENNRKERIALVVRKLGLISPTGNAELDVDAEAA